MNEGITIQHKKLTFTIEKYTCDFFDKNHNDFINEIKRTADLINEDNFASIRSYYIFIAKLTKSVVNCCDITNPVFSYVGI